MTDIVERLRGCRVVFDDVLIVGDAIDEIERLRNALRRIDGINDNPADFNVEIEAVLRAALAENDARTQETK